MLAFLPVAAESERAGRRLRFLALDQMESASVILDRNNHIFGQIYVENRETVPYDQLPPNLVNAVIATEDNKFYQHHGYDILGIVRAALKNAVAGHVRQGASTITQQLARNTFDLKGKTFRRKLLEMFVARRIEENFSKQKILELYLNRIYFGGGLYGAEAAARGYFDKPARDDVPRGMRHPAPAWSRVLTNFRRGLIARPREKRATLSSIGCENSASSTPEQFESAQAEDLHIGNRQNARGQNYAIDYIRQQVIATVGWDRAMSDGFRIHTTNRLRIAGGCREIAPRPARRRGRSARLRSPNLRPIYRAPPELHKNKSPNDKSSVPRPEYLQGAVIALDNRTGGILALVGGRDFEQNQRQDGYRFLKLNISYLRSAYGPMLQRGSVLVEPALAIAVGVSMLRRSASSRFRFDANPLWCS